jgi:hypothetical protein
MTITERSERNAEAITGLPVDELRRMSPEEYREHCEKKTGKKLQIKSEFPFIGRGNVLRDGIISRDSLDSEIDRILKS